MQRAGATRKQFCFQGLNFYVNLQLKGFIWSGRQVEQQQFAVILEMTESFCFTESYYDLGLETKSIPVFQEICEQKITINGGFSHTKE